VNSVVPAAEAKKLGLIKTVKTDGNKEEIKKQPANKEEKKTVPDLKKGKEN